MRFVECPGPLTLIVARKGCFYRQLPLTSRLFLSLLRRAGVGLNNTRRLELGDLERATNVRARAFANAEEQLSRDFVTWASAVGSKLGLDFATLVEKALFETAYDRHFFVELAKRYADEHLEEKHSLHLEARLNGQGEVPDNLSISTRMAWDWLAFATALLALPMVLFYHQLRKTHADNPSFERTLVCAVSSKPILAMFRSLFAEVSPMAFVVERDYLNSFTPAELAENRIQPLGLSRKRLNEMWAFLPSYARLSITHARVLAQFGWLPARMLHVMAQGYAVTIGGRDNVFLTFEHLTLPRAVRNEALRATGSTSVFFAKNSYVTFQFYAAERMLNYDAVCASGPHAPRLYRRKRAKTSTFLEVGSYDAHAPETSNADTRRNALTKFKGDETLITFLSPGLCDETSSHEKRLTQLAARLSSVPGARVMMRLKPGLEGTVGFYQDLLRGSSVRISTATEFSLFDFIGPTDLFVTSISSSACDIALRGGNVVFVDFMHTPDLYLPWENAPDAVLSESEAFERLAAWVEDAPDGPVRTAHQRALAQLNVDLGQRHPSFAAYRETVLASLAPVLSRVSKTTDVALQK